MQTNKPSPQSGPQELRIYKKKITLLMNIGFDMELQYIINITIQ